MSCGSSTASRRATRHDRLPAQPHFKKPRAKRRANEKRDGARDTIPSKTAYRAATWPYAPAHRACCLAAYCTLNAGEVVTMPLTVQFGVSVAPLNVSDDGGVVPD
jgi:hypothetical protein